ncbi:PaaI family thioesterase [Nonomuraea turkmeniaca]|uniref:PaaI family thioesterase n=1 Tax=Nonomuraea turkmeniaca TaxID=103838 RepID=A0A5S4FSM0_9ACTN|nr:PaaI family thioesterase [Nonomuraea turkmeniaca]TMR23668.1 PaaI family thioesterase [Nonomuraea turkmeniaca]
MTPEDVEAILQDYFAPWIQRLGLRVEEVGERHTVVRLPWSDDLAREGGGLSGQAMMAAADTATALAISAARGGFVPMTTVQQSTTFQRPVVGKDVLIDVRITKLGRTLAFSEITLTAEGGAEAAAQATTVYAILG